MTLGAVRKVPYTPAEATAETKTDESATLKVRPLLVDGAQKEWTVGDLHEVTDRSFVIRRALRINDALPGETARWSWQPGPWLMVDRVTGHITALHLPAFDPEVSEAVWFRDFAAYCGVTTTAKGGLVMVVTELGARKAAVQKAGRPGARPRFAAWSVHGGQMAEDADARDAAGGRKPTDDLRCFRLGGAGGRKRERAVGSRKVCKGSN